MLLKGIKKIMKIIWLVNNLRNKIMSENTKKKKYITFKISLLKKKIPKI